MSKANQNAASATKTKNLMQSSLISRSVRTFQDNPYGTTAAFELIRSPTKPKADPFTVTASQIPPKEFQSFDAERLTMRPSYRERRYKFDPTKAECHHQKNNDPQTM